MRRNIPKFLLGLCLSLMMLLSSVMFFACDEKTLDDIPWGYSNMTGAAVLEQVNDSASKMVGGTQESLATPVLFKTTIKYDFQKTINEDFANKQIVDEIELSLSSVKRDEEPTAKLTQTRTQNGGLIYRREDVYSYDKSTSSLVCYTTETTFGSNDGTEEVSYFKQTNYADVNDVFVNLLKENAVLVGNASQTSQISQKEFEGVDYYRLAATTSNTRRAVNEVFSGNEDIFTNPHLFEVKEEGYDYVDSYACAYGINQDQSHYLSYYTLDYTVSRATQEIDGERETYLKVSVISKLSKKGEEVQPVHKPENTADYEVATFVKTLQDENYITYRQDLSEGAYQEITIYSKQDGKCVVIRQSTSDMPDYYFIPNSEDVVYKLNPSVRTYTTYAEALDMPCLTFDYTIKLANVEETDEDAYGARVTKRYYYYNNETQNGFIVSLSDQGKVVGIANGLFETSVSYKVNFYSSGSPDVYYDTTGFAYVEP